MKSYILVPSSLTMKSWTGLNMVSIPAHCLDQPQKLGILVSNNWLNAPKPASHYSLQDFSLLNTLVQEISNQNLSPNDPRYQSVFSLRAPKVCWRWRSNDSLNRSNTKNLMCSRPPSQLFVLSSEGLSWSPEVFERKITDNTCTQFEDNKNWFNFKKIIIIIGDVAVSTYKKYEHWETPGSKWWGNHK